MFNVIVLLSLFQDIPFLGDILLWAAWDGQWELQGRQNLHCLSDGGSTAFSQLSASEGAELSCNLLGQNLRVIESSS